MADDEDGSEKKRNTSGLVPFPKGKSGNPGGRPKGLASKVRQMCNADDLVQFFLDVKDKKLQGFTSRDRMDAAKWLAERGHGKAPDIVLNGELDAESAAEAADVSAEDLADIIANVKKKTGTDDDE